MDSELTGTWQEPWKFKDLNDQMATYRQLWQSDQQNMIMIKIAGKVPGKSRNGKRKIMSATITTMMVVTVADTKEIMDVKVADENTGDAADKADEITTTMFIKKMSYATIMTKRVTIRLIVVRPRKYKSRIQHGFQSGFKKPI
jgi:hypothetical protein